VGKSNNRHWPIYFLWDDQTLIPYTKLLPYLILAGLAYIPVEVYNCQHINMVDEHLRNQILELRKLNQLHDFVEEKLVNLFKQISPDFYTMKEGYGSTSGRTDTTTFGWNGKVIHVEVIASKNMVQRDLLNLFNTTADIGIAVVIDEDIDKPVVDEFYRKNSRNIFPRLWISEIVRDEDAARTVEKIKSILAANVPTETPQRMDEQTFKELSQDSHLPNPGITTTIGIFPKKSNIQMYQDETDDDLSIEFHQYGLNEAVHPSAFFSHTLPGITSGFDKKGTEFFAKTAHDKEAEYCSKVSTYEDGKIILNIKSSVDNLYEDNFIKELEALRRYSSLILKQKAKLTNETLEIWVSYSGLKGKELRLLNPDDHIWIHLQGVMFYEDEFREKIADIPFQEWEKQEATQLITQKLIGRLKKYIRRK
jgi:hypothetical protein